MMRQPLQPVEIDSEGTLRFRGNKVVRYLLEHGSIDLNHLYLHTSEAKHDWDQFYQLIGYSVSGAPIRSRKTRRRVDRLRP